MFNFILYQILLQKTEGKMLKKIFILTILFSTPFLFAQSTDAIKYVGVKKCGMCHKKAKDGEQLKIWKNSKHAQAYTVLTTEKADKIAIEKGFTTKAVETPECLKCHVTAYNADASLLDKKFAKEDGVGCESCHGAGGNYDSNKIMKDKKLSVENGLLVYADKKELCSKCHNSDSPTFVARDMDKLWEEIKHYIPEKK